MLISKNSPLSLSMPSAQLVSSLVEQSSPSQPAEQTHLQSPKEARVLNLFFAFFILGENCQAHYYSDPKSLTVEVASALSIGAALAWASLRVGPFDHFQNMSSGGKGPNLILTLCRTCIVQWRPFHPVTQRQVPFLH